ncbi:tripartite tricarboxylate transporter substrate binding protein [Tardiphaga sp.]|uniref:tripartite tricarboxylate transporter substrate binding protein n=1 Tax=Tardiphaga sp. TaxID=1926292 RepID=UPI00352A0D62
MISRRLFQFGALGAAAMASTRAAWSAAYPTKTVRLICPWPAGGVVDVLSRALAQTLSAEFGQTVYVDNRAGAGGMIGSAEVARAAADGHTLLFNSSSLVQAPAVSAQKLYSPVGDFTTIGSMGRTVMPFIVPKDSPANTLQEFVEYARGRKLAFGTFGAGTTSHAFQQLFSDYNKLEMVHVPYKGEALMLNDILSNQVACAMGTMSTLAPQIDARSVKALAILSPDEVQGYSQIPTFKKLGYPAEFDWRGGFIGLFGPPKLPSDVVAVLESAFTKAISAPAMQTLMKQNFVVGKSSTGRDAAAEVIATNTAWKELVGKLRIAAN